MPIAPAFLRPTSVRPLASFVRPPFARWRLRGSPPPGRSGPHVPRWAADVRSMITQTTSGRASASGPSLAAAPAGGTFPPRPHGNRPRSSRSARTRAIARSHSPSARRSDSSGWAGKSQNRGRHGSSIRPQRRRHVEQVGEAARRVPRLAAGVEDDRQHRRQPQRRAALVAVLPSPSTRAPKTAPRTAASAAAWPGLPGSAAPAAGTPAPPAPAPGRLPPRDRKEQVRLAPPPVGHRQRAVQLAGLGKHEPARQFGAAAPTSSRRLSGCSRSSRCAGRGSRATAGR